MEFVNKQSTKIVLRTVFFNEEIYGKIHETKLKEHVLIVRSTCLSKK